MGKKKRCLARRSGLLPLKSIATPSHVTHNSVQQAEEIKSTDSKGKALENPKALAIELVDESTSVSRTLGDVDMDLDSSVDKPQGISNLIIHSDAKVQRVNRFKDNRKFGEGLKLQFYDNQSDVVILSDSDANDLEEVWGYGVVGYFVGRFPGKAALLRLCDSWKVKYQYFDHASGWLVFKFDTDSDRLCVLNGGPYSVYGIPLMLKSMPRFFEFDAKEVNDARSIGLVNQKKNKIMLVLHHSL